MMALPRHAVITSFFDEHRFNIETVEMVCGYSALTDGTRQYADNHAEVNSFNDTQFAQFTLPVGDGQH